MLVPPEFFKLGPVVARLSEFSSSPEALLGFFLQKYSWVDWGKVNDDNMQKLTITICWI